MSDQLRIKSLINSQKEHNDNVEWDFSSDSDIAGDMERPKRRSKALSRNNSITFAERDQILEFPPGSLPITPTRVMKRIQSKSSFDWDFSDEEHYPTIKASPNRSPNGRRRIAFVTAPPQATSSSGQLPPNAKPVWISSNEKASESSSSLPNVTTEQKQPLALGKKHLEETTPKDPDQQAVKSPVNNGRPASMPGKLDIPKPGEEGKGLLANWNHPSVITEQNEDIRPQRPMSLPSIKSVSEDGDDDMRSRFGSFSSLKRYTSKTSLISTYDFIRDKVHDAVPKSFKKKPDETKLRFVVAFFFLVIVLVISLAQIFYAQHKGQRRIFGNVKFEEHHGTVSVYDGIGNILIEGHIATELPHDDHPYACKNHTSSETEKCLEWHKKAKWTIQHQILNEGDINCYHMVWQSLHPSISPRDCFPFHEGQGGHWYGGGESLPALWPLNKGHIEHSPFITGDEGQTEWGNSIKKYFANSNGVVMNISDDTPLFVSIDDHHGLCIQAKYDEFAYFYQDNLPRLNYTICTGGKNTSDGQGDLKRLHNHFLPKAFYHGHRLTDFDTLESVLRLPLWQVPANNTSNLKQYLNTLSFPVAQASNNSINRGYLLLDHHWQKNMGDFEFDPESFQNITETIQLVNQTGLKLVLTINPFISTGSKNFALGVSKELFVKERNTTIGKVPALTWFKDVASAGLLDVTANHVVTWLKDKLQALKAIDPENILFYLDTGNTFHIPTYYKFNIPLDNPDLYRDYFVKHCMDEVSVIGVSGASSKRPKAPAFLFLSPLESKWESLQSVIPNMLQMSVVGYPFVNPGAVGGVGEFVDEDIELFIRWYQLNTFMPILHFLKPPTKFPKDKMEPIIPKLKTIREKIMPKLISFSKDNFFGTETSRSRPVIRPLWMLDSNDPVNLEIDDEFMIGDEVLVAPILQYEQRSRNIYLPRIPDAKNANENMWHGSDDILYQGGRWLNDFKVDLEDVPYFVRVSDDPLA